MIRDDDSEVPERNVALMCCGRRVCAFVSSDRRRQRAKMQRAIVAIANSRIRRNQAFIEIDDLAALDAAEILSA